ncbi:DUF2787 family protein [Vibrio alginolyticus]|uniref:DUF2787 family protein n=1 Tax=Vibrio alginolyticus TaxID=663 RepID=UPI0035A3A775
MFKSCLRESLQEAMYGFHNKSYSAEQRGFHLVELYLARSSDDDWQNQYVTDLPISDRSKKALDL